MKHYFLHVFILVLLPVAAVFAQPRYSVEKIPMCWSLGSTDSSITKVVLISSASDQLVTIGYYNADGNDITVSGGSLQFGYCGTGGGGGGGDDDWRWYGAIETYDKPLYRIGKTNIFVTTPADTTHGFRVDSTFQFKMDGRRDVFDWQVGGGTGTDYTPHAGLFYRGRNTFESSLVGSGHNNITLGADDNTISDRDRLGAIIFAGKNPAGSGGYRPGAMITAFADVPAGGWSGDSSATSLNFYVTRPNANTLTNTVTFQRDGRVELDRYQFFSDGVPERMLGFDDGSDDVTVHSIDGTPGNNSILGLNATGSGFEWKDQSDVANAGIRYTVYQPAHGFTLPAHGFIPVYRDSVTGWELALANDSTKLHSAYVVEVINSDSIVLMEAGILTVTGGHGLGFGDYFLTNAGSISMSPGTYNDWVATVWDTLTVALKATRPVAPGDTTTYVSGAGTVNVVPKWTSGSVLGNSSLSDDGVKVTTILPFQLPSWTTAGRPGAPLSGFIGWNTTNNNFDIRNSSTWVNYAQHSSGTGLGTSTRIPYYDANGRLTEFAGFTFNGTNQLSFAGTGSTIFSLSAAGQNFWYDAVSSGGQLIFRNSTALVLTFPLGASNGFIMWPSSGATTTNAGILMHTGRTIVNEAHIRLMTTQNVTAGSGDYQSIHINNTITPDALNNVSGSAIGGIHIQQTYNTSSGTANQAMEYYGIKIAPSINRNATSDDNSYGILITPTLTTTTLWQGIRNVSNTGYFIHSAGTAPCYWAGSLKVLGTPTLTPTASIDIDGSIRLRASSVPGSVEDGEMWTSSSQKSLMVNQSGINQALSGIIFTGTANATTNNTNTDISITPTGVGTLTLPANFFVAGKKLRIVLNGNYTTNAVTAPTLQLKLKLGTTEVAAFSANAIPTKTSNGIFTSQFSVTCRTTGASGTVMGFGEMELNDTETTRDASWKTPGTSAVTLDTTISNVIAVTAAFGTADTNNSITVTQFSVEVLN